MLTVFIAGVLCGLGGSLLFVHYLRQKEIIAVVDQKAPRGWLSVARTGETSYHRTYLPAETEACKTGGKVHRVVTAVELDA